ncbi:MAG: phosphopantetheine-binding protein [Chloroflexota bacterium]
MQIVSEQTGYPEDMLELDLDMEADLGIDTVKQAETFLAIREAFDIPRRDDLKLRDYPTLGAVIGFVHEMRPDLGVMVASAPEVAPTEPVPVDTADPVTTTVLQIVSEQTGYPQDMLELDLDMEADLGIDTVKQAETFLAIREAFDIPRRDDLKLRDYPTLAAVIGFVHEMRPDLGAAPSITAEDVPEPLLRNRHRPGS